MIHVVKSVASRVRLCSCGARFTSKEAGEQHEREANAQEKPESV